MSFICVKYWGTPATVVSRACFIDLELIWQTYIPLGCLSPQWVFPPYEIQSGSEILSGKGVGWREGTRKVERQRERERLELMVLHLPGSMSIMALITLNKESISLFSFLLRAAQQKHRRRLKSCSNVVCLHVTHTYICFLPDQNRKNWLAHL